MRSTAGFLLSLAAFAVVGCGDDTGSAAFDLATASDLAVPLDMTVLGCARVLACVAGCAQSVACEVSCRDSGSVAARSAFDALAGCVARSCASGDGGSGACASVTDAGAACRTCLMTAAAQAATAGSPCHSEYASCAAN